MQFHRFLWEKNDWLYDGVNAFSIKQHIYYSCRYIECGYYSTVTSSTVIIAKIFLRVLFPMDLTATLRVSLTFGMSPLRV